MRMFRVSLLVSVLLFGIGHVARCEPAIGPNALANGGFEHDWYNTRGEVMSCPVARRVTFGQTDGIFDGWNAQQAAACQRVADARTGHYAVRLTPGQILSQSGMGYGVHTRDAFNPVPVRFSGWAKGPGTLSVSVAFGTSDQNLGLTAQHALVVGPDWSHVEFTVTVEQIQEAFAAAERSAGPINLTLALTPGEGSGPITLDDLRLERPHTPAPYTLVANPGFEGRVGRDGVPEAWSAVRKSLRHIGSWYYIWRSWYHYMGVPRGANAVDSLMAAAGERSFRMNVPPGDEKYIETAPIALNQNEARRMVLSFDYSTYMLANIIIQVKDEQDREVFFDVLELGSTGGWQRYQRTFVPALIQPNAGYGGVGPTEITGDSIALRACRIRIAARGVNGSNHDDINEWQNVNHAGVLWFDNVVLMELDSAPAALRARGVHLYEPDRTVPELFVESIDLGERLYGENAAIVSVVNLGRRDLDVSAALSVNGPYREDDPQKAGYAMGAPDYPQALPAVKQVQEQKTDAKAAVRPGERTALTLPYALDTLCEDWRYEYRVVVTVNNRATELTFGTWSQQVLVEAQKSYLYPDENPQLVWMNFGVSRARLRRAAALEVEVRRAVDDKPISNRRITDFFAAVASFNLSQLPENWQGDNTNFYQITVDVAALPVHPQTKPVRDHYIQVRGLDAAGNVLFEGRSPRFGRMEVHSEQLPPIQKVEISEGNYLVINGTPFFNRGHMQMQQNFGPTPFSHQKMDFKRTGFNTRGVGRPENPDEAWAQNLYLITNKLTQPNPPLTDEMKAYIRENLAKPNVIGINWVEWESAPTAKIDGRDATQDELVQYSRAIKELLGGRPLWVSAGWYSPTVNGVVYPSSLEHDIFSPENNSYFQPSQLDKEIATKKRARGERFVLNTYPNVFNDMPWKVQRFEHWTEIIRGHTGYTIIGITGDPTLFRGMNGEIRFIESILFSRDKAPEVTVSPNVEHIVRSHQGKTYILASNAGPVIGGDWVWNAELKDEGVASHTGDALWSRFHDFMQDYHSHFYRDDRPVEVRKGDRIVQSVYVPGNARVDALVLMVRGNGDWMYQATWGEFDHKAFTDSGVRLWLAKDMHQMFWGTIGFCGPQGHDIHHPNLMKFVFTQEQFHRIGNLPAKGRWVRLEVPVEQLGLDGKVIDGLGFVSKGDRVWWERTLLLRDGQETVLCDGSVGIHPRQLARVRFNVPGLPAGTRIKVCFEEREIVAGEGYFEDDLTGEPGYQNLWVGLYGDKIGEIGYYGDGVYYNYNFGRIAARLYEIP